MDWWRAIQRNYYVVATLGVFCGGGAWLYSHFLTDSPPQPVEVNTELLIDRSAASGAPFEGGTKLQAIQKRLGITLSQGQVVPSDNLALRVFGGPCERDNTSLIVPFATNSVEAIRAAALELHAPGGETTLVNAIIQATGDFNDARRFGQRTKRIVAITASHDTCYPSRELADKAIAARAAISGVKPDIIIVGVDIAPQDRPRLQDFAAAVGAKVTFTRSQQELAAAVSAAIISGAASVSVPPGPGPIPRPDVPKDQEAQRSAKGATNEVAPPGESRSPSAEPAKVTDQKIDELVDAINGRLSPNLAESKAGHEKIRMLLEWFNSRAASDQIGELLNERDLLSFDERKYLERKGDRSDIQRLRKKNEQQMVLRAAQVLLQLGSRGRYSVAVENDRLENDRLLAPAARWQTEVPLEWRKDFGTVEQRDAEAFAGWLLARGIGVRRNPHRAVSLYSSAATRGSAKAAYALARIYQEGLDPLERDDTKAIEWMRLAAKLGDIQAQQQLTTRRIEWRY